MHEERIQRADNYVGFKPLSQQSEQTSSRGSVASTSIEPDDADSEAQTNYMNSIRLLTYNMFLRPPVVKNPQGDFKDDRL